MGRSRTMNKRNEKNATQISIQQNSNEMNNLVRNIKFCWYLSFFYWFWIIKRKVLVVFFLIPSFCLFKNPTKEMNSMNYRSKNLATE